MLDGLLYTNVFPEDGTTGEGDIQLSMAGEARYCSYSSLIDYSSSQPRCSGDYLCAYGAGIKDHITAWTSTFFDWSQKRWNTIGLGCIDGCLARLD